LNLTFLNTAFLFAALAALLPLVIHLISRRRVATVDFSSLRFLKELERRKIRRVRLRQILLLIIRSLIILFAALALARPTLRGPLAGSARSHARTSIAIVLDDSASMSRERGAGSVWTAAAEKAAQLAELLDEGDQAFLVTAGSPPRAIIEEGTFSPDVLLEGANDLSQGYWSTDYAEAIRLALGLLAGSRNLIRELYVVGDMQLSGWTGGEGVERQGLGAVAPGDTGALAESYVGSVSEARSADPERTRVYFLPLSGPTTNTAMTSVYVERSYGATPGLYSLVAGVDAFGSRGGEIPLRLFIDGVQVGQAGAEIGREGIGSARFSVTVDEQEWHFGRVEIPPDAMSTDNVWHFVIPRVERTEVLLVGNVSDGRGDDVYFVERALDPTGEGARFDCSVIDAPSLSDQDEDRFSVVVLADVERLDREAIEWLRRHLAGGRGVFVVLGSRTDIRHWNRELLPELAGSEIVRPVQRKDGVRLAPAGPGHPILDGLVFGVRLIDDIQVRSAFELRAVEAEVVLELPGIGPALFFGDRDDGAAVACLTTGIDPSWSDLPRSGFVVPLLHRTVDRLARAGSDPAAGLVGDDLMVSLPSDLAGLVEVEGPDGAVVAAEMISAGTPTAVVRRVRTPGIYSFVSDNSLIALRAVNQDPLESDPVAASREFIEQAVEPLPTIFVDQGADMAEAVLQARHGRELWRLFLYAALLLVALEMFLARPRYA
jgi:hypothetical protein